MGQLTVNYDRAPLALSDVKTRNVTIYNPEAQEETIVRGTVLGRLPNGNYQVLKSAAVDGSQFPKAILMADVTIATVSTGTSAVAIKGDFNAAGLVFNGSDTLATAIDAERIEDLMVRQGLYPETVNEMSDYDNQ